MIRNYLLLFSLSIIQFRSLEVMRTSFPNPHPVSLDIEIDMLDLDWSRSYLIHRLYSQPSEGTKW